MRLRTHAVPTGWLVGYIATIPAANMLVTHFGTVPLDFGLFGFGLSVPAGVFMVGIALVLRDLLHETGGWRMVLPAIAAGCVLSYLLVEPALAVASAVAFGVAELADMLVYAPLRRKGLLLSLAASNAVGLVIDSVLFLWIAFDGLTYLWGQIVAKTAMTLLAMVVLSRWVAYRRAHNPAEPAGIEKCGCTTVQRALCGHCRHDRCEDCGTCTGAGHPGHECTALAGAGT